MLRVINNKDRVYNWAKKWQILDIDDSKIDDYLQAWFTVVKEKIEKKNIVKNTITLKTWKECKEILDHAWVEYDKKLKVADLNKLVDELEKQKNTKKTDDLSKNYAEILVDEWIIEESELEWKTDKDLEQLATDNWLI